MPAGIQHCSKLKVMTPLDMESCRDKFLAILFDSEAKLTPRSYIREITTRFKISSAAAKKVLQRFVEQQELCYQYHFGSTYIEKSFLKPVPVSDHFVLVPLASRNRESAPFTAIDIILEQGISFGSGQHPTTRLCLAAIDYCMFEQQMFRNEKEPAAADIGTGSGVLAIALCKSGIARCNAYEIDPVSVHEAKKNIAHNGLEHCISLSDTTMTGQKNTYHVICANLRFPTLKSMSDVIRSSLADTGIAIFSGVREWEKQDMILHFSKKGFALVWQADDKNWSAFVLKKNLC